ncbi:MAG: EF-hand domain-containing protein [Promethearchaeota archaeon]
MIEELEDEELHQIRYLFATCDDDGSGSITINEISRIFKELGKETSVGEIAKVMIENDINNDGTITFHEFIKLYKRLVLIKAREKKIREAFRICDKDNSGYITVSELKNIMLDLGENLEDNQIEEMVKEVDDNNDKIVNFKEFIKLMGLK